MTEREVRDQVAKIVRHDLVACFGDKVVFEPILVVSKVDHDDEDYLDIYIVYEGDMKDLDPNLTLGMIGRIKPELEKLGVPWPLSRSFVEKADWEAVYADKYREFA